METNNDTNKEVVFSQNTAPIIIDILQRYGLREKDEELLKKMREEKLFNAGFLLKMTEGIILGELEEKNIAEYLQNNFSVTKDVAEKIAYEIKTKLVPLGRIASEEELKILRELERKEELEQVIEDKSEKSEINPLSFPDEDKKIFNNTKKNTEEISLPKSFAQGLKKQEKKPEEEPIRPQKNDSYREPIE